MVSYVQNLHDFSRKCRWIGHRENFLCLNVQKPGKFGHIYHVILCDVQKYPGILRKPLKIGHTEHQNSPNVQSLWKSHRHPTTLQNNGQQESGATTSGKKEKK